MLTLSFYLARHFLVRLFFLFALFFFVIFLADLVDLSRSVSGLTNVDYPDLLLISLLRAPLLSGEVFPFVLFFAGLLSFSVLSRRFELVIFRSSGISALRFLFPVCLVSVLLGCFSFTAYNPASLWMTRVSESIEADLYSSGVSTSSRSRNFWLRVGRGSPSSLDANTGDIILRSHFSEDSGRVLTGVYGWLYDSSGAYESRFEADRGYYSSGSYRFINVIEVSSSGIASEELERIIPVNISASHLSSMTISPESVNFWRLRAEADNAILSSRSPSPFLTQFWSLLSHPFLFLTMVLFSACVCLGFSRSGVNRVVVCVGIFGVFVVYLLSRLVLTFGINDLVTPFMSGIFPSLIGMFVGLTILLYREDG